MAVPRSSLRLSAWVVATLTATGCSSSAIDAASGDASQVPVLDATAADEGASSPPPNGGDASGGGGQQEAGGQEAGAKSPPPSAEGGGEEGDAGTIGQGEAGSAPQDGAPPSSGPYACTLVIGILATQQYWADFEKLVDAPKWELIWVHSGFVQLWADPANAIWQTALTSPCAQNAQSPDRIVFVALNFDYNTLAQWLPPLTAAANNLHMKYPSARRIELGTFVRAPGNVACPQAPPPRSTISPAEDQAIAMVVQTDPSLFAVAPKLEAKTCGDFTGNPPHPTPTGAANWAQEMAQYYGLGQ
jgi:hypothetical protein